MSHPNHRSTTPREGVRLRVGKLGLVLEGSCWVTPPLSRPLPGHDPWVTLGSQPQLVLSQGNRTWTSKLGGGSKISQLSHQTETLQLDSPLRTRFCESLTSCGRFEAKRLDRWPKALQEQKFGKEVRENCGTFLPPGDGRVPSGLSDALGAAQRLPPRVDAADRPTASILAEVPGVGDVLSTSANPCQPPMDDWMIDFGGGESLGSHFSSTRASLQLR